MRDCNLYYYGTSLQGSDYHTKLTGRMQILENYVRTAHCYHHSAMPQPQLIAATKDSVVEPHNLCIEEPKPEVDNVPDFKIPFSHRHTVHICCVVSTSLVFCSAQGANQR